MEILRTDFTTLAKSVNFSDRISTAKTINTDVYRATKGLIPEVLRPTDLHEHTSVVLVNTVYFKSFWADHCAFFTNGRRFRTATGKAIFTKFLIRKGKEGGRFSFFSFFFFLFSFFFLPFSLFLYSSIFFSSHRSSLLLLRP